MDTGKFDASKFIDDLIKEQFERGYRQAKDEMGVILDKTFKNGYNRGFEDAKKSRKADVEIPNVTKNTSEIAHCDRFICEKCGIHLKDWARVKIEEYEDGYKEEGLYEYEFEYCPNCGAKVVNDKEDNINTNNCAVWSNGKCFFNGRNDNEQEKED